MTSLKDQNYAGWVKDQTTKAFDSGITGTPTIRINGKDFTGGDFRSPGAIEQAITQAGA